MLVGFMARRLADKKLVVLKSDNSLQTCLKAFESIFSLDKALSIYLWTVFVIVLF